MKKIIIALCIIALILPLCGCATIISELSRITEENLYEDFSSSEDIYEEDYEDIYEEEIYEEAPRVMPKIEPTVLYDSEGVKITATELRLNDYDDFELNLLIENNNDYSVHMIIDGCSVNGFMVSAMAVPDIAAGKKANDVLDFSQWELDENKIDAIGQIDFLLTLYDEDFHTVVEDLPLSITTDTPATSPDLAGTLIFDAYNIKIYAYELIADEFGGYEIAFSMENNGENPVSVEFNEVSINDFTVNSFFYTSVSAGKKAIDTLDFYSSDLEDNNIETISEIEFFVTVTDTHNWDRFVSEEPVILTFN